MTARCCIACAHAYRGPLACPRCGAPGEPLPSQRKRRRPNTGTRASAGFNARALARVVAADAVVSAWLEANAFGDSVTDALASGGCRVFAEGLVAAAGGRLRLMGVGAANHLADDEEGDGYEHVVAFDPQSDRYLDAHGAHTAQKLRAAYRMLPAIEAREGPIVIQPFEAWHASAIPYDARIAARIAGIIERGRG